MLNRVGGWRCLAGAMLGFGVATSALSQGWDSTFGLYGTPGLIDTPTAFSAPDATLSMQMSDWGLDRRTTLSFQITPRLSGSFRYSRIEEYTGPGTGDTFDRSFDLRYRLVDERRYLPAVAIGLQDFMGTGLYSSEYVVASKTLGDRLAVSLGLGWGRLGSLDPIAAPFGPRPVHDTGLGGKPSYEEWFRGDMAVFGGAEYRLNDRITLKAEYSSDAYARQSTNGSYLRSSPFNLGLSYRPRPGYELGLSYLYGNEIGLSATFISNPRLRPSGTGYDPAPIPVAVRSEDVRAAQSWDREALPEASLTALLTQALALEGATLRAVEITDGAIRIRYENGRYRSEAQALGRIARILTQALPASIETFILEPSRENMALSAITLSRSDLERFENEPGGTNAIRESLDITSAPQSSGLSDVPPSAGQKLSWGLAPYLRLSLFDPSEPIRADYGLALSADYRLRPNVVLSGKIHGALGGNLDGSVPSDSVLPHVRSDVSLYAQGGVSLQYLTLAAYGKLAPDVYSRVTVGYLEPIFGGVSGELLWAPAEKRYALGAEVNYAVQRDYDMGLGFQDYDIVTGHVSGYYAFENGFNAQIDVGRYLAGDWGATVTAGRELANGWEVGAYFTITDVPFEDFGEGSFDKGIFVTIPMDWISGSPDRRRQTSVLNSLSRDGGARLNVEGRLYDIVRDGHAPDLGASFGRFWR